MEEERLVTSTINQVENEIENVLRPKSMEGYYDGETWTQSNFTSLSRCPYNANGVWVASCQQYTVYSVTWEPSA